MMVGDFNGNNTQFSLSLSWSSVLNDALLMIKGLMVVPEHNNVVGASYTVAVLLNVKH